jgi:threonine dehydratase
VVPAFDDTDIIAGQGTLGLELVEQCAALGFAPDDVLVPASGGGLIAGVAIAMLESRAQTHIFSVEPADYDDHRRSLAAGTIVRNASTAVALCDALLAAAPGKLTWPINQARLRGGYAVTDDHVFQALRFAFESLKLVLEPGGAVALAALLAGIHPCQGRTTIAVLSGGNVDAHTLQRHLSLAN